MASSSNIPTVPEPISSDDELILTVPPVPTLFAGDGLASTSQTIPSGKGDAFISDIIADEPIHEGPTENPIREATATPPPTQDEVEEDEVHARYKSEKAFSKAQTESSVTEKQIETLREQYQIPNQYQIRRPEKGEKLYWKPEGAWVAIPIHAMMYGVRFPLHEFIFSFLSFVGIGFSQLVPNSYIHLICFIAFCHQNNIVPALDLLSKFFSLTRSKENGFRQLNKRPGGLAWMETPSSNKGWHPHWVYMSGGELSLLPRWGEPDKRVLEFDKMSAERTTLFNSLYKNMPKDPWPLEHLSSQKWLFDHKRKSSDPYLG